MANLASPSREEEVFLENGRLSYENPNYQLHFDSVRLDDALNSNTEPSLASLVSLAALGLDMDILPSQLANMDLAMELDLVSRVGDKLGMNQMNSTRNRRTYASLDVHSMGVNVDVGPVMNLSSPDFDNNRTGRSLTGNVFNRGYSNSNFADRSGDAPMDLASPSSEDSPAEGDADVGGARGSTSSSTSILSVSEPAPVHGRPTAFTASQKTTWTNEDSSILDSQSTLDETEEKAWLGQENVLPLGWEKHEDADGPYYWHIKSGTIQREPPSKPTSLVNKADFKRQMIREAEAVAMPDCIQSPVLPCVPRSTTSFALSDLDAGRFKEEAAYKRRSYPASLASEPKEKPIRFAVRSLGWVEIAEEDLTPERSSKAVNRCIVDLSLGRHDLLDVVGRWGDGKDLFMDLDEGSLKLVDPETLTVLNTQPIHTIRVWGVGRDNGRDFAYVARDRTTRRHMCHVFRCDTPARTIANTLRDICKKIMIERNLVQSLSKPVFQDAGSKAMIRPSNLPTEQRRHVSRGGQFLAGQCFPTPMEEPRKVLKASYVGCTPVQRPTGIEVLNDAIDRLVGSIPASEWKQVNVSVAPSVVTITPPDDDSQVLLECRVRFLSFMGIGHNVKHCGFIVHTAHDEFQAHIFDCQPSSGALCKTIEAACKLRYQKCLDAHGALRGRASAAGQYNPALTPTGSARSIESIGAALKSVWGSFSLKRDKANSGGATVGNS